MPLRSLEVELGPSQYEFTFAPERGLAAADTMVLFRSAMKQVARRHGYLRQLHVPAALAAMPSPAAGICISRCSIAKPGRTCSSRTTTSELLSPLGRHYLAGLLAHARAGGGLRDADGQRLQALSRRQLDGADPGDLGQRQPRRDDPRAGRAGRSGDASGEPRRRAARQSVSLHGVADSRGPRRHRAQARARAVGRCALREVGRAAADSRSPRRSPRSRTATAFAQASATPSSTTTPRIKEAEIARCDAESGGQSGNPTDVTAWEHKEYFDLA